MAPLPAENHYSYADLLAWDDGVRYELYSGVPVALSSPSSVHQDISGELHYQLKDHLRGKKCRVYYAPFDVRLFEGEGDRPEDVDFVLQPDLMVVCDESKVDRRGVHGAPDLIIEILSPATARYDKLIKFNLYQQAGVQEYWLVDPVTRTVCVYVLQDGAYHTGTVYSDNMTVPVSVLNDCHIDLARVFS